MTTKILICIGFGIVIWVISLLSFKNGKKTEQIKRLKEEIKHRAEEQKVANEKVDFVRSLSKSDIDERLRKLAKDQQRNNL